MYFTLHRVHLTNKCLAVGLNCKKMYMKIYGEIYTVTYTPLEMRLLVFRFPSKEKIQVYKMSYL